MNRLRRIWSRIHDSRVGEWPTTLRAWLSVSELDELAWLRHEVRRTQWLAGRWLLKSLLRDCLLETAGSRSPCEVCDIEILSRDAAGRGQTPRVLIGGCALGGHVSLAHSDSAVWAAVSMAPAVRVGIDVVPDAPLDSRLIDLWFTRAERHWLEQAGNHGLAAPAWSAKEAIYKATNRGEPFMPARFEIGPDAAGRLTWKHNGISRNVHDTLNVRHVGGRIVVIAVVGDSRPNQDADND